MLVKNGDVSKKKKNYFFLKHLNSPESQILECDWLILRAPAVRIFPSWPHIQTAPSSRIAAILAAFCNTENLHEM